MDLYLQIIIGAVVGSIVLAVFVALIAGMWISLCKISISMWLQSPIKADEVEARIEELQVNITHSRNPDRVKRTSYQGCVVYSYTYGGKKYLQCCDVENDGGDEMEGTVRKLQSLYPDQKIMIRQPALTLRKDSLIGKMVSRFVPGDISTLGIRVLRKKLDKLSSLEKPTKAHTKFPLMLLRSRPSISRPANLISLSESIGGGILMAPLFLAGLLSFITASLFEGTLPLFLSISFSIAATLALMAFLWGLTFTPLTFLLTRPKYNPDTKPTESIVWGTEESEFSPATTGD